MRETRSKKKIDHVYLKYIEQLDSKAKQKATVKQSRRLTSWASVGARDEIELDLSEIVVNEQFIFIWVANGNHGI